MEETKHIVILAAGDFPTHPVPLQALREADFVVCCDSAYGTVKDGRLGIGDYVVVGDGDSLSEADKAALGNRWIEVGEQDYNDLHKAMEYATKQFTIHNSQFIFTVPAAVLLPNERRWPIGSPKPSEQAMCMSKPTCSPPAVPPLANDLLWWPSSAQGAMPAIMTANR